MSFKTQKQLLSRGKFNTLHRKYLIWDQDKGVVWAQNWVLSVTICTGKGTKLNHQYKDLSLAYQGVTLVHQTLLGQGISFTHPNRWQTLWFLTLKIYQWPRNYMTLAIWRTENKEKQRHSKHGSCCWPNTRKTKNHSTQLKKHCRNGKYTSGDHNKNSSSHWL